MAAKKLKFDTAQIRTLADLGLQSRVRQYVCCSGCATERISWDEVRIEFARKLHESGWRMRPVPFNGRLKPFCPVCAERPTEGVT